MVLLQASRMMATRLLLVVGRGRSSVAWKAATLGQIPRTTPRRSYTATTAPRRRDDDGDDATSVVYVSIEEARSTTAKALQNLAWDAQDAALQAEIMTAAELCGNNQGTNHDTSRAHTRSCQ